MYWNTETKFYDVGTFTGFFKLENQQECKENDLIVAKKEKKKELAGMNSML